jgi:hypothetical protein
VISKDDSQGYRLRHVVTGVFSDDLWPTRGEATEAKWERNIPADWEVVVEDEDGRPA